MPLDSENIHQAVTELVRQYANLSEVPSEPNCYPLAMSTIHTEELAAAIEVLLSGRLTMGVRTEDFEKAWSKFLAVPASVMVNSGSSANLLAMSALASRDLPEGLKPGDEVIVPAVTWPTTVFPISQVGCVPVLVDVDVDTLNVEPQTIRDALTPKTRAIVVVHLLGNPCAMRDIMALAQEHNLFVVEDCCEAHGAKVGDQLVGTFGQLSTFSYFFSHHMTTIEGGMVSSRNGEKWADRLCSLRAHGWIRERSDCRQLAEQLDLSDDRWVFVSPGYNLRPTEINAALGLVQLAKLPGYIERRADVRNKLLKGLRPFEDALCFQLELPDHFHSPFGFSIIVRRGVSFSRDELRSYLESKRIETRPIVGGNLARQPACQKIACRTHGPLPGAEHIDRHGLMIGINPDVSDEQINYMIDCINDFIRKR